MVYKVLYGRKHGLYKKNLCQTLFCHETSFPSSYGHQSGTIWIRKPFSIILDDQNQVPYDQNNGLYMILMKIIEFVDFLWIVDQFFFCCLINLTKAIIWDSKLIPMLITFCWNSGSMFEGEIKITSLNFFTSPKSSLLIGPITILISFDLISCIVANSNPYLHQ